MMNRNALILAGFLLVMDTSMNASAPKVINYQNQDASTITVGDYEKQEPTRRAKTLNNSLTSSLAAIVFRLHMATDANGTPKSEAQATRDRERATRAESIVRNLDTAKLADTISRAARIAPSSYLGQRIMSFIRYEVYAPDVETFTVGELSTMDHTTRSVILTTAVTYAVSSILARLRSLTNAKGLPKSEESLQKERNRAAIIEQIRYQLETEDAARNASPEAEDFAARIAVACVAHPDAGLVSVIYRFFLDTLLEREARMSAKPPSPKQQ